MQYSATSKYIRMSPRKLVVLADSVRKLAPTEAVTRLTHLNKNGANQLKALIESAAANAKVKSNISISDLAIERLEVVSGPVMKRFRAASRGMAHGYKKRMSHVRVILTQKTKKVEAAPVAAPKQEDSVEAQDSKLAAAK